MNKLMYSRTARTSSRAAMRAALPYNMHFRDGLIFVCGLYSLAVNLLREGVLESVSLLHVPWYICILLYVCVCAYCLFFTL